MTGRRPSKQNLEKNSVAYCTNQKKATKLLCYQAMLFRAELCAE